MILGTYLHPSTGSHYGQTTKVLGRNHQHHFEDAWECDRSRDVTFMLLSRIFSSEEAINALMV